MYNSELEMIKPRGFGSVLRQVDSYVGCQDAWAVMDGAHSALSTTERACANLAEQVGSRRPISTWPKGSFSAARFDPAEQILYTFNRGSAWYLLLRRHELGLELLSPDFTSLALNPANLMQTQ